MPEGTESLYMLNTKPAIANFGSQNILPQGYTLRNYRQGISDYSAWCNIEIAVGDFEDFDSALAKFDSWTKRDEKELSKRCMYLCFNDQPIGTVTAWEGEFAGTKRGLIHWLAITPEHQGKGLSRYLLSQAMVQLTKEHDSIFLKTDTSRIPAINLYLSCGFEPAIRDTQDAQKWQSVASKLKIDNQAKVQNLVKAERGL